MNPGWTVEYNNDVGPNDEGFWEWHELCYAGERVARFDDQATAEMIRDLLNAREITPCSQS